MNDFSKDTAIDIVIPWVDGNDPAWQAEKAKFSNSTGDNRAIRYRDWDNLQYVFRGIEKFLPWVRTVHFITWGHLPAWMNPDCPKLHIVNHKDYIPVEYLPTYNSHVLELNMHRIEGLAENFIYTNDDIYFLRPIASTEYFQDGKPVDTAIQNVLQFHRRDGIDHIVANDLICLNQNFQKKQCIRANRKNWFSSNYGVGGLQNLYLMPLANFTGFVDYHMPNAYAKHTFEEVWAKESEILKETSAHKVRTSADVSQWLMRYWQLAKGDFVPGKPNKGQLFAIGEQDAEIEDAILHQKYNAICLSDDDPNLDFEKEKRIIQELLQKILPEKSSFER